MAAVPEYFGSLVFDDRVMKSMLTAKVYASLKKTQPAVAEELFKKTEESSKERLAGYKKMAGRE